MSFKPLTLVISFAICCEIHAAEKTMSYPPTRRVDHSDTYHGVKVPDPYRWLEDDVRESEEVAAWVEAQNKVTFKYLNAIKGRAAIERRLTKLWDHERFSTPYQVGGKYFFRKNDGLQNQSVLYVADSYDGPSRVLIDPNGWSADGTVALDTTSVSNDGRLMAYSVSEAGSDWKTIRVLDVADGRNHKDEVRWIRWGGISWNKSSTGFYYGRYPTPDADEKFQVVAKDHMIYYHKLGTSQAEDVLVHEDPEHPDWGYSVSITDDGEYLIRTTSRSTDPQNQVHYLDLRQPGEKWVPLFDNFDHQFSFIGNQGERFFFRTDYLAPTKRIVAMDLKSPALEDLVEIVPAAVDTLQGVSLLAERFHASYLKDATTRVKVFSLQGEHLHDVSLPGIGTAAGFGGREDHTETFYSFTNYATPPTIYRYDVPTGESEKIRQPDVAFDSDQFVIKQVFIHSKDGTKLPVFIAHDRRVKLDGSNPTLLYGYGGFNISLTPGFSVSYLTWMEMGGVLAIANLRGGGEYGEPWHLAGKKFNKQNVFDDFIAAAEWLVAEKYTSRDKLAIMGGSNGGLLVGAVMTQRPELCRACLPAVGVMDMLRYHQFTAGVFWRDEYGTVDDEREFHNLMSYSPYQNLRPAEYPSTLVTTADTDDRVVPMHSFKFIAALQHAQQSDSPVMIRVETRAGHGAGTPTAKLIERIADTWAFLTKTLKIEDVELRLGE